MHLHTITVESPIGTWGVIGDHSGVHRVAMPHELARPTVGRVPQLLTSAARQLNKYFAGDAKAFRITFADITATPFQRACWEALAKIPYGSVATYGEIARAVGHPFAARAVGNANHANPWPVFYPCHRVVASNALGGYGGGVAVKEFLLQLEGYDVPYTRYR